MRGAPVMMLRLGQALARAAPAKQCGASAGIARSTVRRAFASAGAPPNLEWVEQLRDKSLFKQQCFIGGEWVGASKRNHPDFLWLPTGPGTAVAGGTIRYAQVASLLAASVTP